MLRLCIGEVIAEKGVPGLGIIRTAFAKGSGKRQILNRIGGKSIKVAILLPLRDDFHGVSMIVDHMDLPQLRINRAIDIRMRRFGSITGR